MISKSNELSIRYTWKYKPVVVDSMNYQGHLNLDGDLKVYPSYYTSFSLQQLKSTLLALLCRYESEVTDTTLFSSF